MPPYQILPGWLSQRERVALNVVARRGGWQPASDGAGCEQLDLAGDVATIRLVRRALDALGGPMPFFAALIRYPVGCEVPAHTDPPTAGLCHMRIDALVLGSAGGLFYLGGEEAPLCDGDAVRFRPDQLKQQLTAVERNARVVLSVSGNVEQEHARRVGLA